MYHFLFNIEEMVQYPHIGIFGDQAPGKSYGLRVLMEEIMKKSIPANDFDPHYDGFERDSNNPSANYDYS